MIDILKPLIKQFMPFAQEQMGFDRVPRLFLKDDEVEADNPMGKTGFYDPSNESITIYIGKRHPKDIMRSLSHELMHHTQKCNGEFDGASNMGEQGYAQNDGHLRKMEIQAYQASIVFRDWEDSTKGTIYYEHLQKGNKKMSTKDWKNTEIRTLLAEAWGFKFNTLEEFNEFNENADKNDGLEPDGDDDTSYGHIEMKEEEAIEEGDSGASKNDKGKDKDDPDAKDYMHGGDRKGDESKTHKGEKDDTTKKGDELKDTEDDGAFGEKKGDKADVNESEDISEEDDAEEITEDSGYEEKEHDEDNAWKDEDHIAAIEKHLDALKHDRDYEEDHESLDEVATHKLSTKNLRIEEKRLRAIIKMALKESSKK